MVQLLLQGDQTPGPKINKELKFFKMYTVEKDFYYQQPEMIYEKKQAIAKSSRSLERKRTNYPEPRWPRKRKTANHLRIQQANRER